MLSAKNPRLHRKNRKVFIERQDEEKYKKLLPERLDRNFISYCRRRGNGAGEIPSALERFISCCPLGGFPSPRMSGSLVANFGMGAALYRQQQYDGKRQPLGGNLYVRRGEMPLQTACNRGQINRDCPWQRVAAGVWKTARRQWRGRKATDALPGKQRNFLVPSGSGDPQTYQQNDQQSACQKNGAQKREPPGGKGIFPLCKMLSNATHHQRQKKNPAPD